MQTHELNVDGHKLSAICFNPDQPGFPIVFMHGVMSSTNFWTRDRLEPFLPYGPCYSLSLPGHYPAEFPPGFCTADFTADCMAEIVSSAVYRLTGGQPALLAGHSTGGFAALAAAAFTPQSARGVISIAGFAQGRWRTSLGIFQWLARHDPLGKAAFELLYRVGGWEPLFRLTAPFHSPLPRGTRRTEESVVENLHIFRSFSPEAMQIYFAAMYEVDILEYLERIRVPVLALAGDADPAVPPSQAVKIAARIPGAEHVILKGGVGHIPFAQRPEQCKLIIDAWMRKHFG